MDSVVLTERQQAELEFYEEHARRYAPETVTFDPVEGRKTRPWNSYWFVYEQARAFYAAGARRALDFGCGKGAVGILLARVGYDVAGFDISSNSIEVARALAARNGLADRTDFSVQVAEDINYADASFDLVVGMDILHHVEIAAAVGQAMRVLKPGGTAIFREHIQVPAIEWLRNTPVGRWLVPPGESLERNITRFERKLTDRDLECIRRICPDMQVHRFTLLSRLEVLLEKVRGRPSSRLERLDYRLFKNVPALRSLGATGVIILRKAGIDPGREPAV